MRSDFFQSKKPWSPYKDMILSYYLTPYLPKVCCLGKPVVVVDCFAGPGRFEDGAEGSPLIIAKAVVRMAQKDKAVSALLIEEKKGLFERLRTNLGPYKSCCRVERGSFGDCAEEIAKLARNHTVFVYLDPYGIKPLRFATLAAIYENIQRGSSVEVLLNLNTPSLVRNGLAVLKCAQPGDMEYDLAVAQDEEVDHTMTAEDLDSIAGGKYWRKVVCGKGAFADMEQACLREYMNVMSSYFDQICSYGVRARYEHTVPKYRLVFGSRHPDAFVLMNDAVCNARDDFLGKQRVKGYLFDMRGEDEIHDPDRLREAILSELTASMSRENLVLRSMRKVFGEYKEAEHKRMIADLIKSGRVLSASGKARINDHEVLSMVRIENSGAKA
ncbi:MAG: three-Cys-motif partner protein TcmP [Phycisphaerae bacterium]|nr:three-Cys-motif partner protein TcmP [Phycisphaerae bacterium]